MARRINYTTFSAEVNGTTYEFKCWATPGCHHCKDGEGRRSRYSFGNRPWESFQYETVLKTAIRKCPKGDQPGLQAAIIDRTEQAEREAADKQLAAFQGLYNGLNDRSREIMRSFPELRTEADVRACMGFMGLLALTQEL